MLDVQKSIGHKKTERLSRLDSDACASGFKKRRALGIYCSGLEIGNENPLVSYPIEILI